MNLTIDTVRIFGFKVSNFSISHLYYAVVSDLAPFFGESCLTAEIGANERTHKTIPVLETNHELILGAYDENGICIGSVNDKLSLSISPAQYNKGKLIFPESFNIHIDINYALNAEDFLEVFFSKIASELSLDLLIAGIQMNDTMAYNQDTWRRGVLDVCWLMILGKAYEFPPFKSYNTDVPYKVYIDKGLWHCRATKELYSWINDETRMKAKAFVAKSVMGRLMVVLKPKKQNKSGRVSIWYLLWLFIKPCDIVSKSAKKPPKFMR
jgi:hypothetical protein